jgi:hypothetical protein
MKTATIATFVITILIGITAQAQELPTTGKIDTRIGTLEFEGGYLGCRK